MQLDVLRAQKCDLFWKVDESESALFRNTSADDIIDHKEKYW